MQPKPQTETHTHTSKPQPVVAGCKRVVHTSTHTTQHPNQEWRGAAESRAETHTPTPHTPARSGGVQAEHPTSNSRKPSVHSPGTEAARAMQVTRPHEMRRPGRKAAS